MTKVVRIFGTVVFFTSMIGIAGFWWGRTTGHGDIGVRYFGTLLLYTSYALIAAIAFMLVYGGYTIVRTWIFGDEGDEEIDPTDAPR
jgi:hypothetical protein